MTVLHFGALSDRSTFTLTDARAMNLRHGFFGGTSGHQGVSVTSLVCVLAVAGDVLTKQHSSNIKQKLVLQLQMLKQ
jgi:hypothetical protein